MKRKSLAVCALICTMALLSFAQEQKFANVGDLKLVSGEVINNCRVGYRAYGQLNADKSNVVVFPTWFGGTSEQVGNTNVGPGKLVDSSNYYVIVFDALADGVSSSPSNSTEQHGAAFPKITIRDMVESQHEALTKVLGLSHVRAVVGISMGGMQTFQWAVAYPEFMDRLIPVVGTPQLTSYDLLLWNTELDEIRSDPQFQNGNYKVSPPLKTVAHIMQLNMMTPTNRADNISPAQFGKFYSEQVTTNDANDTVRQLEAMLALDIPAQFGGSWERAVASVKAPMLVIAAVQDHMVNPLPAIKFAELRKARLLKLQGDCGHLAPGCEADIVRPVVAEFLK